MPQIRFVVKDPNNITYLLPMKISKQEWDDQNVYYDISVNAAWLKEVIREFKRNNIGDIVLDEE